MIEIGKWHDGQDQIYRGSTADIDPAEIDAASISSSTANKRRAVVSTQILSEVLAETGAIVFTMPGYKRIDRFCVVRESGNDIGL